MIWQVVLERLPYTEQRLSSVVHMLVRMTCLYLTKPFGFWLLTGLRCQCQYRIYKLWSLYVCFRISTAGIYSFSVSSNNPLRSRFAFSLSIALFPILLKILGTRAYIQTSAGTFWTRQQVGVSSGTIIPQNNFCSQQTNQWPDRGKSTPQITSETLEKL